MKSAALMSYAINKLAYINHLINVPGEYLDLSASDFHESADWPIYYV